MKSRNKITSTLLALLLSLSMIVTYLPASMIAYATEGNDNGEIVLDKDAGADTDTVDVPDSDSGSQETEDHDLAPETGSVEEEAEAADTDEPAGIDDEVLQAEDTDELDTPEETTEVTEPKRATKATKTIGQPTNGTVLAFTSDTHNQNGNVAANRLGSWLDTIAAKDEYGGITAMAFGGDMAGAGASGYWDLTQADMDALSDRGVTGIYTTGNHEISMGGDFSYNSYTSNAYSSTETKGQFELDKEVEVGSDYRIYCLGSRSSSSSYADQVSSLTSYLNSVGNDKVIFIITHFPLHYYKGSGGYSMGGRSTQGASDVIDALNNAVDSNHQTIVFLWGHNHTLADTYYDQIYGPGGVDSLEYASGSSKTIKFYYGAAGCMSDYEYSTSGSQKVLGKGLVVSFTPNRGDETMKFAYYDDNGIDVTETNSVKAVAVSTRATTEYTLTDKLEAGKEYLIASGDSGDVLLLSNESTDTAKQLKGIDATVSDGKITIEDSVVEKVAFSSESNSNSSQGGIWLKNGEQYLYADSTNGLGLVASSTQTGSSNNTKSWHYKADDKNLLWFFKDTTSQDGYTDTSNTYRYYLDYSYGTYFTDAHVGSGQSLSNTTTPAVYLFAKGGSSGGDTPDDPPAGDETVEITPESSNSPEESATIAVGETLVINVKNGSSSSAYDFTATLGNTGIAELKSSATVHIEKSATGEFVVEGLADGTVDITIQNNGQYSNRKGTIHLTVGDGGSTPVDPADKTVDITPTTDNPEESITIAVGETLAITVTNGSTREAYDFTATLGNTGIAELQSDATVHIDKSATGQFIVKGLTNGTVDITISNNSSYGDQYSRKGIIHLTVGDGGSTPVDPADKTVDITPTTDNPEGSITIAVGETLAINVINGSSSNAYDFTATLDNTSIAALQSDAIVHIEKSATGQFVVKGLTNGTVDITISNNSSYGDQYSRKGTIHLTVGDGGSEPGAEKTYVLTETMEAGKDYLIATSKDGNGFILSNENGSVSNSLKGYAVNVANNKITITEEEKAKTLFTASGSDNNSIRLMIGGKYLYADGSGALRIVDSISDSGKCWHYMAEDNGTDKHLLWFFNGTSGNYGYTATGSYKYYLQYDSNGNFTKGIADNNTAINTVNTPKIYLFTEQEEQIPATAIDISSTEKTIQVGENTQLTATVTPEDATGTVEWSSNTESVATVDSTGKVTGVSVGTATITATIDGLTAECTITVDSIPVESVTLDKTTATVMEGRTLQLNATVLPENATDKTVTWTSSNSAIASVDQTGKVTGEAVGGPVTITATAGSKSATCAVTVEEYVAPTGYVILIDGYALSNVHAADNVELVNSTNYHYKGLNGVEYTEAVANNPPDSILWTITETTGGYYIQDSEGNYLNAVYTATTNPTGCNADLKVDNVQDVWQLEGTLEDWQIDGSTLKSTNADKSMTYEESVPIFTIRSTGETSTIEDPAHPITTETIYVETDALTVGKKYIVAAANSDTSVYALNNSSGSVVAKELTVTPASGTDAAYIALTDEDTGVVWNYTNSSSNYYFINNSQYLRYDRNDSYILKTTTSSSSATSTTFDGQYLKMSSRYVARDGDSFNANRSSTSGASNFRIFMEKKVIAGPGISLDKSTMTVPLGETGILTATPKNAEGATITWSSSDEAVATVNDGIVSGVSAGTATITATMTYEGKTYTATCDVTVKQINTLTYDYVGEAVTGKTYVIVSNGYALVNNNGAVAAVPATVSGNTVTLLDDEYAEANMLWTVGEDGSLKNGNYYVRRDSGNNKDLLLSTDSPSSNAGYMCFTYDGDYITVVSTSSQGSGTVFYIFYDSGWKSSSTQPSVTTQLYGEAAVVQEHTVTFNTEDGTLIDTVTVADGTAWTDVTKPEAPAKEGYTFSAWTGAPETVTEDVEVTASYTINTYTVTFNKEDGTKISDVTVNHGTAWADVTKPEAPAKEGYTFKEWTGAPETVTADVTVTASYTVNKYTVTFNKEDGTKISDVEVDYGTAWDDVTKPEAPAKEGYTFKEWTGAPETVTADVFSSDSNMPESVIHRCLAHPGTDQTLSALPVPHHHFLLHQGSPEGHRSIRGSCPRPISFPSSPANLGMHYKMLSDGSFFSGR